MTTWQSEKVYHDGDKFFADLQRAISQAKHRIDFETYIYEKDALGDRCTQWLIHAARRGVRIRILIDGIGSPFWRHHYGPILKAAGIEYRIYRPYPWAFFSFPFQFKRILRLVGRVNRRNHRKVCLIDQNVAWLGSMNVSAKHLREFHGDHAWRDSGVRLTGGAIRSLERVFDTAWEGAWRFFSPKLFSLSTTVDSDEPCLHLNDTRLARIHGYRRLLHKIEDAQQRVWITNSYFVPPRLLVSALRRAAMRGVDVRIIVPEKSDVRIVNWAASAFYGRLLSAGVHVYEYMPSILHAKTLLIDDWGTVGTNNLDTRSLWHNFEAIAILSQASSITSLTEQFEADLKQSQEIDLETWSHRPLLLRFAERLALFLRYWI